ncbi:RodZ family helix-turn-helix domain-containing protein [Pusillimonas sp. ANT_WB101]|uniref:helix-turn-helix domain-containing protein n=1 Tax=Pusillimonas sp. ANT_WB101 TaxID=2597356 RepID=UPI0011EE2D15|nr:helix-turn-helix transcriptional regulator [Pusillimonas sp. ANT_WB101]KAA0911757.1 helix-turn-helix domain-containing protein [Pusillimonas sp. ANT_WB101]
MNLPLPKEEAQPGVSSPGVPVGSVLPGRTAERLDGAEPSEVVVLAGSPLASQEGGQGVGSTLQGIREAKRISRNEASARVKYSVRQIEALETEQWGRLPGGAALRGFVKNYSRYLGADVDALLIMLDDQAGTEGIRAATTSTAGVQAAPMGPAEMPLHGEAVRRPWGWLVIILVLLFVAGFYAVERGWVPDSWLVFDWLKSLKS